MLFSNRVRWPNQIWGRYLVWHQCSKQSLCGMKNIFGNNPSLRYRVCFAHITSPPRHKMWGIRSQSTLGRGRESDGSKERPRWKIVSYACTNVKNEKVNQFDKKGFGKSYYFASYSRVHALWFQRDSYRGMMSKFWLCPILKVLPLSEVGSITSLHSALFEVSINLRGKSCREETKYRAVHPLR